MVGARGRCGYAPVMASPEDVFPGTRYTGMLWIGRILSGICALLFLMSAMMKLVKGEPVLKAMETFGMAESLIVPIGVLELVCLALYLIPRTAVLGAVLLTGYLGGATVTHLRVSDPFIMPVIIGVVVWFGIWFREPRLRAILPLR